MFSASTGMSNRISRGIGGVMRSAALIASATVCLWIGGIAVPVATSAASTMPTHESSGQSSTPPTPASPSTADVPPLDAADKAALSAAADSAHATGRATPVAALTTETQLVTATPHGGFTLTENLEPVRTQVHGTWVPVNTALHRNDNGTFSPTATAYGTVVFSGGGKGILASTASGSTGVSISWPAPLPGPVVKGNTATYRSVYPGVDLVMTANAEGGFSDVLVVNNVAAGRNPALTHVALPVKVTGGRLTTTSTGGLQLAPSKPGSTLTAAAPVMWDSATAVTSAASSPTAKGKTASPSSVGATDPSDVNHAGAAANRSSIKTAVTGSTLNLNPDRVMLASPTTVFPVFMDPTVQWSPAGGTHLAYAEVKQGGACHATTFYNGANADGQGMGVGFNHWDSCIGVERTFYQWNLDPTLLAGATINTAALSLSKEYSGGICENSTDNLHLAGGISSRTTWDNQPSIGGVIATAKDVPAANCRGGGYIAVPFNVTAAIQSHTANAQIAFALTGNESSSSGNVEFSRFAPHNGPIDPVQPSLVISYNRSPFTPKPITAFSGSDKTGCVTGASGPYPYMGKTITSDPPVLDATISDPDGNIVQAKFEYWLNGSSTMNTVMSPNLASGSGAMGTLSPSFVSGLVNGQVVDWNVAAFDGLAWSPWSATCHFTAEPTAPTEPTISSGDGAFQTITTGQVLQTPAPTNRWLLNSTTGNGPDTPADNPAVPHGRAIWFQDPTEGPVLALDGVSGYASTSQSAIATMSSYSVSAWVKLNSTATYSTAVSQAGTNMGAFYLQYNKGGNAWEFLVPSNDSSTAPQIVAKSVAPPTLNAWTNLIGTFDASSGAMTLYVNGVPVGTANNPAPWNGPGPLTIGGVQPGVGSVNNFFDGEISDVQIYSSALNADQADTIATPIQDYASNAHAGSSGTFTVATPSANATSIVYGLDQVPATSNPLPSQKATVFTGGAAYFPYGRWKLTDGSGTIASDSSGGGDNATLTGSAAYATDTVRGAPFLSLNGGYATAATPAVNTASSFSVSAWVKLNDTNTYYTAVGQSGSAMSAFYLQYNKAGNAWEFVLPSADSTTAPQFAAKAPGAPSLNWTHLVGTFDASAGTMTLYVNGVQAGTAKDTSLGTLWNAPGPLTIGAVTTTGGTTSNQVHGGVSDVQVYGRVLTAGEVAAMYGTLSVKVTPLAPGPHTLYAYAVDAAGDISGFSDNAYTFEANQDPAGSCADWQTCLNSGQYGNNAIQNGTTSSGLGADGADSIPSVDLTAAGWKAGGKVTIDGATFTLPSTWGTSGANDNVLAENETISGDFGVGAGTSTVGTTSLVFLATTTGAPVPDSKTDLCSVSTSPTIAAPFIPVQDPPVPVSGTYKFNASNPGELCPASGVIHFKGGGTQPYQLSVPDWIKGPISLAAVTLPHETTPTGSQANPTKIYAFSVPLTATGTVSGIDSITLPDVAGGVGLGSQALHIFGIAPRNTTVYTPSPTTRHWTGDWSSPTEGLFNFDNTAIAKQTFRIAMKSSLSGNTVRIKFDNALDNLSLTVTHATIALDSGDGTVHTATAASAPTNLTFAGGLTQTIPGGGMVYSDPLTFTVTANQYVLVSFALDKSVTIPTLPRHNLSSNAWEYTSAADGIDHSGAADGSPFTGVNGSFTNVVTGMDVATNTTDSENTQVVVGDNLVDAMQPNAHAVTQSDLATNLSAISPTAPVTHGTLDEGIESNEITADYPQHLDGYMLGGPSLVSRLDRDVLDQPGIDTVIVDEGLEDVLHGAADDVFAADYQQIVTYLKNYGITVIAVGLPPCAGYAGDGAAAPDVNDPCTDAISVARTNANTAISGAAAIDYTISSDAILGATVDGSVCADPCALNASATTPDKANLGPLGFAALASAYMGALNRWDMNNVDFDPTALAVANTAGDNSTPYDAINHETVGDMDSNGNPVGNDAILGPADPIGSQDASWVNVPDHNGLSLDALDLDGNGVDATTSGPIVDTTHSFTVGAWVRLPASPTRDMDIVSQDGANNTGAALQYNAASGLWSFTMAVTDSSGGSTQMISALSQFDPIQNEWTHLVGTYNAKTGTATLYVDGVPEHSASWPTGTGHWTPSGPLSIGGSSVGGSGTSTGNDFLVGDVSDVRTWNYALSPNQINALAHGIG